MFSLRLQTSELPDLIGAKDTPEEHTTSAAESSKGRKIEGSGMVPSVNDRVPLDVRMLRSIAKKIFSAFLVRASRGLRDKTVSNLEEDDPASIRIWRSSSRIAWILV